NLSEKDPSFKIAPRLIYGGDRRERRSGVEVLPWKSVHEVSWGRGPSATASAGRLRATGASSGTSPAGGGMGAGGGPLVRLLTRDDARQAARGDEFVAGGAWISHLVLAQTTWVLSSAYGLG